MPTIIKQGVVYSGAPSTSVWEGTQADYDLIASPDPNVTYFITDGVVNPMPAKNVEYDNTLSGLSATTVQSAIDEVTVKKANKVENVVITMESGVTVSNISLGKIDKMVYLTAEIRFTSDANTWTNLATLSIPPVASQLGVPAISCANGTHLGIVQVTSAGVLRVFPISAVSNGVCGFTMSYRTA